MTGTSLYLLRLACAAAAVGLSGAAALGQCNGYTLSQSTGAAIVPGTTDSGNHVDDGVTAVALPFSFNFYGSSYTSVNVSSNGVLQFTTSSNAYTNVCPMTNQAGFGPAIFAFWDDLYDAATAAGQGVFTTTTGSAPSRSFYIEYRSQFCCSTAAPLLNFEVVLHEAGGFDMIYAGTMSNPQVQGNSATIGAQDGLGNFQAVACNIAGLTSGSKISFAVNNNPNVLCAAGGANPSTITNCGGVQTDLLSVSINPAANPTSTGMSATVDLSSIGGSSSQVFYDDGTHGDAAANDNMFSFRVPVPNTVTPGTKLMPFTVADAQGRTGSGTINLTVTACPTRGPDVYVGSLTDVAYYGVLGNLAAYAVGTNACNAGDLPVGWYSGGTSHPVIAQNVFRLKNGRFEQLGGSWLKYGFASTNSNSCGTCQQPPDGGSQLGVNCSDAYGSGLNGGPSGLGPRSLTNSTTGAFPASHPNGDTSTNIGNRCQVYVTDIDPAQNTGATYFAEAHYIAPDDARFNDGTHPGTNGLNNSSYQQITNIQQSGVTMTGAVHQMLPAIMAWRDADPAVQITTADYLDQSLGAPGIVARFWIASRATNNGNGTWHYEYAAYNFNADRAGGSFSIPVSPDVTVTNVGFHGIFYHSGEPYPNTAANLDPWSGSHTGGAVTWSVPEAYAAPQGDNGNALRWGTLYNFRFDANIAPGSLGGVATVGLWKPATAAIPATSISSAATVPGTPCGSADFNHDGSIGTDADIEAFFGCIGGHCCPTCGSADFNGDGDVATDSDIEAFFRVIAGGNC